MQQSLERPLSEKANPTFRVIRKRKPWTSSEDHEIMLLVNSYGRSNWTLIASELNSKYPLTTRSGKQCRERWHNHLDPQIRKDYWTEKEESILFSKHYKYGNKWSDIAKHLPGRTDNSIKNYFYSKLRKFLRKIVKEMTQEKLFMKYHIDHQVYNSDKIYHMIKRCNMAYANISKKEIIDLIIKHSKRLNLNDPLAKYRNLPRRLITVVLSKPQDYGYRVIDLKDKIIINESNVLAKTDHYQPSLSNSISESDTASLLTVANEGAFSQAGNSPLSAFTKFLF